jgi:DNA-directed RNA polymerase specialized sigma54-like protein
MTMKNLVKAHNTLSETLGRQLLLYPRTAEKALDLAEDFNNVFSDLGYSPEDMADMKLESLRKHIDVALQAEAIYLELLKILNLVYVGS